MCASCAAAPASQALHARLYRRNFTMSGAQGHYFDVCQTMCSPHASLPCSQRHVLMCSMPRATQIHASFPICILHHIALICMAWELCHRPWIQSSFDGSSHPCSPIAVSCLAGEALSLDLRPIK
eukprot:1159938-Pelagomonas_calceolata.AAC.14